MSAIIFFDGVCNFCDSSVQFIFKRDPSAYFQFCPLQSATAEELLSKQSARPTLDSILLLEDGKLYDRSTAALRIARRLSGAWPLLYGFIIVPRPIRDAVYGFVARNRYRWFGKKEACMLPTPALRARFIAKE